LSERPDLATDQKAGSLSGALLRKAIAIEKKKQYLFATRKSRKCDDPLVVAKSLVCAIEGQWNRKLARNKWPRWAALANESKI
jgi:hypothetical protein